MHVEYEPFFKLVSAFKAALTEENVDVEVRKEGMRWGTAMRMKQTETISDVNNVYRDFLAEHRLFWIEGNQKGSDGLLTSCCHRLHILSG